MNKKTLVIGASENTARYSNKAIVALKGHGHDIVALAKRSGSVSDIPIQTNFPANEEFDTVTLYVAARHQSEYYDPIINLKPKRVIFNPGTENPEFVSLLKKKGIEAEQACTLVLLSIGSY